MLHSLGNSSNLIFGIHIVKCDLLLPFIINHIPLIWYFIISLAYFEAIYFIMLNLEKRLLLVCCQAAKIVALKVPLSLAPLIMNQPR